VLVLLAGSALGGDPATDFEFEPTEPPSVNLPAPDKDFTLSKSVLKAVLDDPGAMLDVVVSYRNPPTVEQESRLGLLYPLEMKTLRAADGYALKITAADALALALDPDVAWITTDSMIRPALDVGLETVGFSSIPDAVKGLTGAGVTVAVLDSGIGPHPDLLGRVIAAVDIVEEWKNVNDPLDIPLVQETAFVEESTSRFESSRSIERVTAFSPHRTRPRKTSRASSLRERCSRAGSIAGSLRRRPWSPFAYSTRRAPERSRE
jgi:subtilisin family serine protease